MELEVECNNSDCSSDREGKEDDKRCAKLRNVILLPGEIMQKQKGECYICV